ncbi:MAG TPA: beta-N-acetylhexosaminidase [Terracidiphilus sp.]|nr:beta-N-acetylhexosaminidase [Terracidiphilus sp.]
MKLAIATLTVLLSASWAMAAPHPALLPQPRQVQYGTGSLSLQGLSICFASAPASEDRFAAAELARGLAEETGVHVPVRDAAGCATGIVLDRTGAVDPLPVPGEKPGPDSREAYQLTVGDRGIRITGRSSAGVFYGVETLLQLAGGRGAEAKFPQVAIRDWPTLAYRGTLVDVGSEGPMCTVAQVERQLDLLARFKGNQYFFYSEANIALDGYPLLNPQARFTKAQVREIIAYGRERHIEIVPALELFGHLHDLFRIEKYSDLSDFPHGGELDPANPKVKILLRDWVSQIADLFPSPFVDIGFDETFSIQKAANQQGAGATPVKLFIEQLRYVTDLFQARGKHVMAYADIMVKFPDIIPQLPSGLIALPWYYNPHPDPEYHKWLDPLVAHHVPHMVVPAVSSWDEIAPDFSKTLENVDTFLAAGRKSHSLGLVNTVWTDDGQMLMQMSWPGMAYGAAAAWQTEPIQRNSFFADYSRILYPRAIAPDVAHAYTELNAAEQSLQAAVGQETQHAVWEDPFAPRVLSRVREHRNDLRECRLHAEQAEEALYRVLTPEDSDEELRTTLVGARLLDYTGMKYLYALEMEENWATLPPRPTRQQLVDTLSQGFASQVHSRTEDLMVAISELEGAYRRAWLAQYTHHRLREALGRWDAEYQFWRSMQTRVQDLEAGFHDHDALPPLGSMANCCIRRQ